jgi:hypothetical protein
MFESKGAIPRSLTTTKGNIPMKAFILVLLMGGRKLLVAAFVCSMLLAGGEAMADAKKGVPTKLVPQPKAEVPKAPSPTASEPPPVTKVKCEWVEVSSVTFTAPRTYGTSAQLVPICGGFTSLGGASSTVGGDTFHTMTLQQVCK